MNIYNILTNTKQLLIIITIINKTTLTNVKIQNQKFMSKFKILKPLKQYRIFKCFKQCF